MRGAFAHVRIARGTRHARTGRRLPHAGEGAFDQVARHRTHRSPPVASTQAKGAGAAAIGGDKGSHRSQRWPRSAAARGRRRRSGRFTGVMALSSHTPAVRLRGEARWPVVVCRLGNDGAQRYGEIAQFALVSDGRIGRWGMAFPSTRPRSRMHPNWQSRFPIHAEADRPQIKRSLGVDRTHPCNGSIDPDVSEGNSRAPEPRAPFVAVADVRVLQSHRSQRVALRLDGQLPGSGANGA